MLFIALYLECIVVCPQNRTSLIIINIIISDLDILPVHTQADQLATDLSVIVDDIEIVKRNHVAILSAFQNTGACDEVFSYDDIIIVFF